MKRILTYHLDDIDQAVDFLLSQVSFGNIVAVDGAMGSGKTTLIKAAVKRLGTSDSISSPTFSIVNTYQTKGGMVHHFDLYRLNTTQELVDLGFDIYLDSNSLVLIEWPELAMPLLPQNTVKMTISINSDNSRSLSFER
jgi:tRNA threonylcarbamoyladenosine biosynthesis protein TsaE